MQDTRRRSHQQVIKVTPDEHLRLRARADELGLTISTLLRSKALAECPPITRLSDVDGQANQAVENR